MKQNNLQKNIGIFLGIIIICGVLFVTIFWGKQSSNTTISHSTSLTYQNIPITTSTVKNTTTTKTIAPSTTPATPSYTLAQVATHSSASSCWSIIQNNVYDLTSWINQHPGGAKAILSICGKDGTSAFEKQHGGQARPENELKNFLIGVYSK
jgi:cytochrome b involved in lipid metabolism